MISRAGRGPESVCKCTNTPDSNQEGKLLSTRQRNVPHLGGSHPNEIKSQIPAAGPGRNEFQQRGRQQAAGGSRRRGR